METKPKRGRPPLPENRVKGGRIEIRVSDDEQASYTEAAQAAGLERSEWIRDRLNRAAKRERQ